MKTDRDLLKAHARTLREAGHSWAAIARFCEVEPDTVRYWLDPDFAAAKRERVRAWRTRNAPRRHKWTAASRSATARKGWRSRKRRKVAMERLVKEIVADFADLITGPRIDADGRIVIPPRRSDRDGS